MSSETCTSCNRTYSTYHLTNGKCRICLRKENNAHDLDMLTDEEYEEVMGRPRKGRDPVKKQHKRTKSDKEQTKQKILKQIKELTDEDFEEILKSLT